MTIKSIVELLAQADTALADNTTGDITASDVRTLIKDFLDTIAPAYGAMNLTSAPITLSAVPQVIAPFASVVAANAGYYNVNLVPGNVTRLVASASLAGATDFIIVDGNVEGPNGDSVTVQLYKNGSPMPFTTTVSTTGAGEPIGFNLVALTYTAAPGDAVYEVRASGDAGVKTFSNIVFLCQAQPVRSFT